MDHPRQSQSISRRSTLALAGAMALGLGLRHTSAQDATPQDVEIDRRDHPLTGPWRWNWDEVEPGSMVTVGAFDLHGVYFEYDSAFGVGLGYWQPTGERTADLVLAYQSPIPVGFLLDLSEPVPESLLKPYDGRRARSTLEVDVSGNTVTWKAQFVDGDGNDLTDYFTFEVTGTRLTAD